MRYLEKIRFEIAKARKNLMTVEMFCDDSVKTNRCRGALRMLVGIFHRPLWAGSPSLPAHINL